MGSAKQPEVDLRRRDALQALGAGAVAASIGGSAFAGANGLPASAGSGAEAARTTDGPYNILFILTDQERHFRPGELPKDCRLPGHERLAKQGIAFENHQINSCVCASSR